MEREDLRQTILRVISQLDRNLTVSGLRNVETIYNCTVTLSDIVRELDRQVAESKAQGVK